MSPRATILAEGDARTSFAADLGVSVATVTIPWVRPGLVHRGRLVDRLLADESPVIHVVAPAGYGKTTLLAQWCERTPRAAAWVSLSPADNDPVTLLRAVAAALDRVEALDEVARQRVVRPLLSPTAALDTIAALLSHRREPVLLVLDNAEVVDSPSSLDVVEALAVHQPPGSQLVIASRHEVPGATARRRGQGVLLEVRGEDLGMREPEARALFAAAGVRVDDERLGALVHRCEGWPAGLYLTALTLRNAGAEPAGDERPIADYVRSEVFATLPAEVRSFLVRTSILERVCASLCDAVLGTTGSQETLEHLERSNLLVVPLDRKRTWYRYHHLLAEFLRSQLLRQHADEEAMLHERASAWFGAHGHRDEAVTHAQLGGDEHRAAELVAQHGVARYAVGHVETVRRWIAWFDERGAIAAHPAVAVLGGMLAMLEGRPATAQRLLTAASGADDTSRLPDGSTTRSWVHVLAAGMCADGIGQMRLDAELALDGMSASNPLRPAAQFFLAIAHLLARRHPDAEHQLSMAVQVGLELGEASAAAASLGLQAALAMAGRDWSTADDHMSRALQLVDDAGLDDYVASLGVFATASRAASHAGDVDRATVLAGRAQRLRPLCTYAFPPSTLFLGQLAHALLALADPAGARSVTQQMRDILHERPDLGAVTEEVELLRRTVEAARGETAGLSSLTAAELRIVPFLPTHLSLQEIGERTHLSRHTVKTHTMSIYRKAGASSRSEAIEQLRRAGILLPGGIDG